MVLSYRTRYAVRAVFELAKRAGSGPATASSIADSQAIPLRFLENILGQLRQAGIIESIRGKDGGYVMARRPEDVAIGDVIRLIQGPISAMDCTEVSSGRECSLQKGCVLLPVWEKAHNAMMEVYDGTTFARLVEDDRALSGREMIDYVI